MTSTIAILKQDVSQGIIDYQKLATNEKLILLWYIYTKVKTVLKPVQLGSAGYEIAEELLKQVKKAPLTEQIEIKREIIEGKGGLISYIYGSFNKDTKLYFWYLLAQGMESGKIASVPSDCEITVSVTDLLYKIELMSFEQQITFLKDVLALTGAKI